MDHRARPYRSVLYIPGSKPRALDKATTLPVDAIIFDLEDAVAVEEKANARTLLAERLTTADYGARAQIIRINDLSTDWGREDLAALAIARPRAILLPKVDTAADIEELDGILSLVPEFSDTRLWAMMETPLGILNAAQIAAAPRMAGFVLGTNDLAKDLDSRFTPDRMALMTSLQFCLLAARAHGLVAVDGVYNAFKDAAGLEAECRQGRDMGFDGKSLIHPAQVDTANAVFAPSAEDLDFAHRQIAAFEAAEAAGQGVAVVDGRIVENLHVATARQIIAKARVIATLESS